MGQVLQAGVQIATFAVITAFDWSGTYTRSRLKIAVYCFFNMYAAAGLLKLWIHGNRFESIVNSVLSVEQTMISAGIQLASTIYVKTFFLIFPVSLIYYTTIIFLQLRRSILFGMAFVVIYALAQMFLYYSKIYLGFNEGFKIFLIFGRTFLHGPTNCTSFGPGQIDGGKYYVLLSCILLSNC